MGVLPRYISIWIWVPQNQTIVMIRKQVWWAQTISRFWLFHVLGVEYYLAVMEGALLITDISYELGVWYFEDCIKSAYFKQLDTKEVFWCSFNNDLWSPLNYKKCFVYIELLHLSISFCGELFFIFSFVCASWPYSDQAFFLAFFI